VGDDDELPLTITLGAAERRALDERARRVSAGRSGVDPDTAEIAGDLVRRGLLQPVSWCCDACGGTIENAEQGLLVWAWSRRRSLVRGLRIVHLVTPAGSTVRGLRLVGEVDPERPGDGCRDLRLNTDERRLEIPLRHLVDGDGLTQLLERVAEGKLPLADLLRIIMRLHLPRYEEGHQAIAHAMAIGVVKPNLLPGFYWQDELAEAVRFLDVDKAEKEGFHGHDR
jgi:hypothetical protein